MSRRQSPRRGLLVGIAAAILCVSHATSSLADARFRQLAMEDGISNNEVYGVIQDSQGYMWFATGDGLDRYDGYTFRVFRHDPNDPGSVSGNFARALYEDPEGRIWLGTFSNGLDLYDPKTGIFKHYHHIAGDPNSLISDNLWALSSLPDGRLLIGTRDAGLDIFDPKDGRFQHHPAGSGPDAPSNNYINRILVDHNGRVWVATLSGLDEYDPSGKEPTRYFFAPGGGSGNDIISLSEDAQGRLWLATKGGPYIYIPGQAALSEIPGIPKGQDPMAGKFLYSVLVDSHQDIWYGGEQTGLYLIRHDSNRVMHYQHVPGNHGSLASNEAYDIFEDRAGYIWVGTAGGTNMLDQSELDIYSFKPSELSSTRTDVSDSIFGMYQYHQNLLLGGVGGIYQLALTRDTSSEEKTEFIKLDANLYGDIRAITAENDQDLIVGTAHDFLLRINSKGKILKIWRPDIHSDIKNPIISDIKVLHGGGIYLATFGHGLLDFNPQMDRTEQISGKTPQELSSTDVVETLLEASSKKIWAGTFRGLFEVDTTTKRSVLIPVLLGDTEPVVQGLYEDAKRTLWIATYDGLWHLQLDADGNPKSRPQVAPQFDHTQLLSIQPDIEGNLWLAGVNKLIRFNPSTGAVLYFGREQGSPMNEYYSYGHIRTSDGRIWFAGGQGAIGFQPDALHPNTHAPQVVMNGVTSYLDGKPVFTALRSGTPLTLSYQDSISIFDVAATDYGAPQANTYSYRLLGFQAAWTPPGTSHQITFTNLSPGRYRLEIKAANNWGIWGTTAATQDVIVLPPWWRTWWAYTLYLLIITGSSIGYVYSLKRKIEREQEISTNLREANDIKSNFVEKLESQVRKATHELRETLQGVNLKNAELEIAQKRAAEAEQIKSQFLANMSHELRTPLTGVLGYTKLLSSTHLNSEQKDYVGTIKQSSETLLAIINDTLDLSRLEAGKLLIDQVDFDLLEVIESTLELLAPTAYQKRLELVRVVAADVPLYLRGDPLRLRQVLTNLLSNAIKFTEHGSVAIEVKALSQDERETKLMFNISDTGIGIPAGELSKLFHAYARSRISTQHHVEGTGLGLAICKKLLDLMGGDIKVTSKVGTGTSFEFQLIFRVQKNAEPRSRLPRKIKVLLYDAHPLSSQAWRACLMRLGAEVEIAPSLESVVGLKADAAIMVLSEKELTQLGELKRTLTPVLPPMLILAPRIERQALKDLSETLFHRVLSKTAREKTLYLELQSLLQTVIQDVSTASRPGPSHIEPAADAPKILVADDNRINRRLLVTMLNHAGFRVSEAANGLELLDLAAKGPWDAALLDIHMPGMDGIEAAKRLRESLGDALPPVIAMSADVMPETRKQVMEGIMDDFMVKPFSEQELVDKLRWHLDRHLRKKRTAPQDD